MTARRITSICLLCTLTAPVLGRAAEHDLAAARELLLGGNYAEAAEIYSPLAEKKDPAAVLGLARCLSAEGKRGQAVKTLAEAADDHAQLHAELARLAFERGDVKEAKARADEALRLDADQLLARWILAELHRTAGRLDEAEDGYRGLIEFYNAHDVQRAESLRWIGLGAARYARWNRVHDQFSFLVSDLYREALKLEPDYWPAHYEAGMLFVEKYNQADAAGDLRAALELNPNAAEVHVALARLAVSQREVDRAAASIDRALEINPRLQSAWVAKADLAWANFDVEEALRLLEEKALPLSPIDEQTLGRIAACYVLLDGMPEPGKSTRLSRLMEGVTGRNKHAGEFFFALAVPLADRHKHPQASKFFLEAMEVMPQKVGPRSHLGLLQMRAGRESAARKLLEQAFQLDPFNLRVGNTLQVLDVLDSMEILQTDHVTIKYDGQRDKLLARYAAKHLEAIYPELCRKFGYRPPGRALFEIFNTTRGSGGRHWLSTRMIGLPYVGPVAASTGRMVAMTSPYDAQSPRQLNWARVLTHEAVHVITLQQTDFNIPHWYTEGLAVYCEGHPRPQRFNELLIERVRSGELFNLQTINFGFTRPNSGSDCQMAYCQSELYVEYMLSRWGSGRQRRFLAAYSDAKSTEAAIRQAFGLSQEKFEEGYKAYLKQIVGEMSTLEYPSRASFAQLLESHRDNPKEADAAAELAYAYVRRQADQEALDLAAAALATQPKHQLAAYVLARLWLTAGRTDEAVELLEDCLDHDSPQPNALNLLAALKLNARQYDEAARLYALGERLDAVNLKWTRALARVYLLSANRQKLAEALSRLARSDVDDLTVRKKLAQLALDRGDHAAAADWANQALQIDVMDAEVHRMFARALVGCHNYREAIDEFEVAVELEPTELSQRFALANAHIRAKQPAKARRVLEALLELKPDYPGAATLLESLEETDQP
jgi:tetratricopeptide (TPR) repeat protein